MLKGNGIPLWCKGERGGVKRTDLNRINRLLVPLQDDTKIVIHSFIQGGGFPKTSLRC